MPCSLPGAALQTKPLPLTFPAIEKAYTKLPCSSNLLDGRNLKTFRSEHLSSNKQIQDSDPGSAVAPYFRLRLSDLFAWTVNIATGYGSFAAYASGP
jgi:hypothetical protein